MTLLYSSAIVVGLNVFIWGVYGLPGQWITYWPICIYLYNIYIYMLHVLRVIYSRWKEVKFAISYIKLLLAVSSYQW